MQPPDEAVIWTVGTIRLLAKKLPSWSRRSDVQIPLAN